MDWRFLISLAIFLPCLTADRLFDKIITTANGPVQGIVRQSRNPSAEYVSFMGLRYADPPSRFEPAKPFTEKWSIPKIADTMGNVCLQPGDGSEDCLFLNVHVPSSALKNPSKRLPVMFFIHGGGFTYGDGQNYGAKYLMENENVILVTVNYRLGIFGFISLGEKDTAFTANNGLRDSVLALKWVQQNIEAFHGNPNKVTVFGESAGSSATNYIVMSPLAKGLFHRAIMQSGAYSFLSYQPNPGKAAQKFAESLNCPNTKHSKEIRKCLEGKSGPDLASAQLEFADRWPVGHPITRFLPTAKEPQENAFFPGEPSAFFTFDGQESPYPSKVPVILGVDRDEGSNFLTSLILQISGQLEQLKENWNEIAPKTFMYDSYVPADKLDEISQKLRDYYFGQESLTENNLEPLINLYSDSLIVLPIMQEAKEMAQKGLSVYPYVYSYLGPVSVFEKFKLGYLPGKVGHADELQHLFDHPIFGAQDEISPGSTHEKFSKRLVKLWTKFADTGVPELAWDDNTTWKAADVGEEGKVKLDILEIDDTLRKLSWGVFEERLEFWREILQVALNGKDNQRTEL